MPGSRGGWVSQRAVEGAASARSRRSCGGNAAAEIDKSTLLDLSGSPG